MLLGAALVLVGAAVLYYAVTGQDPRKLVAAVPIPRLGGGRQRRDGAPRRRRGRT